MDSSSYEVGYSYQDFLDGKWVQLDSDQENFHQDNPDASVKEVIAMQLDPEPPGPTEEELLAKAKDKKVSEARNMLILMLSALIAWMVNRYGITAA